MLKLLIVVAVVVALALWFLKGRRPTTPPTAQRDAAGKSGSGPAKMVACAHCGVHLPRPEASYDAEGRSYCGEPHRVAGPR